MRCTRNPSWYALWAAGTAFCSVSGRLSEPGHVACDGVLVLRSRRPDLHRPFRVPFSRVVPAAGVVFCLYFMVSLPRTTWFYFLIRRAPGPAIYAGYPVHCSRQAKAAAS